MNILNFKKWVMHRDAQPPKTMPESDRLMQVVAAAGPQGLSRDDLGQEIQLDRDTLDDLLDSLVQLGQISVA